jgi:VWFA-related protein
MRLRGAFAAALVVAALAFPRALPIQSAINDQPSAIQRVVTVDLSATDARGRRVADLKASDLELRHDGTLIPIEGVRFVPAAGVEPAAETWAAIQTIADERAAAASADVRLFAIFLDDYHVTGGPNAERVRRELLAFLDRDVHPRDLIVVMKPLDSLFGIRLTRDRGAARRMIEAFAGRKGEYDARNAYERDYIAGTPARIEAARSQVALSAINALAIHLGSLTDRRKTLIVAAEGIGRGDRRRGEILPTLDTIVRSANRANVAIYPLDPRGADAAEPADDGLRRLADETDGRPIAPDVEANLRAAAADAGAYYLVSFRAAHPDDGKFRALEARAKRAGVRVRARRGYWAAPPDEALRTALLTRASEPKRVVPPEPAPHVSTLIRPWFGVSRGESGKSRVTFVWEPAVRVPGDRVRRVPARLVLTARSADGKVLFEGPVAPTGPAAIDDPAATPSRAVFDMAPGRLRLRMAIQDAASQLLDQDVRDLSIRDLRGDVAIGTPEVLRARNAREFRTLDAQAAVPVASREFSRTERLFIRFQAYGPEGAAPLITAKLLARTGQAMRELAVAPASTPGESAIDLPLAGLATGEYMIEVTATSGKGDAKDRIGFRVTS